MSESSQELLLLFGILLVGAALWTKLGSLVSEVRMGAERAKDHSSDIKAHTATIFRIEEKSKYIALIVAENQETIEKIQEDFGTFSIEILGLINGGQENDESGKDSK